MNALLYHPGSKRPLIVAFAAAAAVHLSAFALSANHPVITSIPDGEVPIVDGENVVPEPTPEPDEPLIETEQSFEMPVEDNDFYDEVQPTPRPKPKHATPIRANRMATGPKTQTGSGKLFAISAPRPNYPYEARSHNITGSGAIMLDVDPTTGTVINARVIESTGSPILDNSALSAFRRWRFKNGTPSQVRIPYTFTMFGAQL